MSDLINRLQLLIIGQNTAYDYTIAIIIFITVLLGLKFFQILALYKLRTLNKQTKNIFNNVLIEIFKKFKLPIYVLTAFYLATRWLIMPEMVKKVIDLTFVIAILIQSALVINRLIDHIINIKTDKHNNNETTRLPTIFRTLGSLVKAIVWILAGLTLLANFGINVTSLIAGLGIGGIAVALALKNVLSDLFSSIAILIDRPFTIGDPIKFGENFGTVERIGLKSTSIRTPLGEELIVSNRELTDAKINNFGRLEKRRVLFKLGLVYGTPADKLRQVPNIIKQIISTSTISEFDRCHFVSYGDSGLIFEIVFYVNSSDYVLHLDELQRINLGIYEAFIEAGLKFAFPTQTVVSKN